MATIVHSKTVLQITDTSVAYLSLGRDEAGYFVSNYEEAQLPLGVIKRGEVLQADFLHRVITNIKPKITDTVVDLLFPHEYFLYQEAKLPQGDPKETNKSRIQKYFRSLSELPSWQQSHVCEYEVYNQKPQDHVIFRCVPVAVYESYRHIFEKSGLRLGSISSEILAFGDIIKSEPRSIIISFGEESTLVAEFRNGIYSSLKKFQVSYRQLHDDVKRTIPLSQKEIEKILQKFGILRTHKDERVYRRLMQSFTPLFDFLSKRKSTENTKILVSFSGFELLGLKDALTNMSSRRVEVIDPVKANASSFHDILSLHRKDSYRFAPLIAQALKMWKR